MSSKTLLIKSVRRKSDISDDAIELKPGVNVIVGLKDTGKTGWLQTISYLLGDTNGPEDTMRLEIAAKFDMATLILMVGSEEVVVQRRWKEPRAKHKIFVNGEGMSSSSFGEYIQDQLGIPLVRFPKGNPYSRATWPLLSWRMLFRHIYREERFWNELADMQPPKEQHACLLQFLGAAQKAYSKEFFQQVHEEREIQRLIARDEQFSSVLQEMANGLIPNAFEAKGPTIHVINECLDEIASEIQELENRRRLILEGLRAARPPEVAELVDSDLGDRHVRLSAQRDEIVLEQEKTSKRLREIRSYSDSVKAELARLQRADLASEMFATLKVTQCPVCDRKVTPSASTECYLCHRPNSSQPNSSHVGSKRRLEFEREQLEGEAGELEELCRCLKDELFEMGNRKERIDDALAEIEAQMRPIRTAFVDLIPPDISVIDVQIGQKQAMLSQLQRLRQVTLGSKRLLMAIDALQANVEKLSEAVENEINEISFDDLSGEITDGINEYLNAINEDDADRWPHGKILFDITDRTFKIFVGHKRVKSLGATSLGYVLLGYHYALLRLSGREQYSYPGIALIDFPMTLADKVSIADKENYLIEPFVKLSRTNPNFQLIVCGRAFEGLQGVHRITLQTVWKQETVDVTGTIAGADPE